MTNFKDKEEEMKSTIKWYEVALGKSTDSRLGEKLWHDRWDVCYTFETEADAKAFQAKMEQYEEETHL